MSTPYFKEVRSFTPQAAQHILDLNKVAEEAHGVINRKSSSITVTRYMKIIADGEFRYTPEAPLAIDNYGRITNGHQRIQAVAAGKTHVHVAIIYDADPHNFEVLDGGRNRGAEQVLEIAGFPSPKNLASGARRFHYYTGLLREQDRLENYEVLDFVQQHPDVQKSLWVVKVTNKILGGGMAVGLHYAFARKSRGHADQFFASLGNGANLSGTDPILVLRENIRNRATVAAVGQLPWTSIGKLVIITWNAWLRKERITGRMLTKVTMEGGFPKIESPL